MEEGSEAPTLAKELLAVDGSLGVTLSQRLEHDPLLALPKEITYRIISVNGKLCFLKLSMPIVLMCLRQQICKSTLTNMLAVGVWGPHSC